MTNYEMIKNQDIYAMALTIMCPYEAGFLGEYRCEDDKTYCVENGLVVESTQSARRKAIVEFKLSQLKEKEL